MKDIPFDVFGAVAALVYALSMFTDNIVGKQWSSVIKQAKTWAIGVLATVWAAHLSWTGDWTVGNQSLQNLTLMSQVFLGLVGSAGANTIFHLGQRFDRNGSGDTPDIPVKSAKKKLVRNNQTTERKAP